MGVLLPPGHHHIPQNLKPSSRRYCNSVGVPTTRFKPISHSTSRPQMRSPTDYEAFVQVFCSPVQEGTVFYLILTLYLGNSFDCCLSAYCDYHKRFRHANTRHTNDKLTTYAFGSTGRSTIQNSKCKPTEKERVRSGSRRESDCARSATQHLVIRANQLTNSDPTRRQDTKFVFPMMTQLHANYAFWLSFRF